MIIIDKTKRVCQIVDFAIPYDTRVNTKEVEKIEKYQDLARKLGKPWKMKVVIIDSKLNTADDMVNVTLINNNNNGMKRLKDDIREPFNNEKDLPDKYREMYNTVFWESETMRKILSGLLT
ncbi:Hypothetical predicted protein [Paramuricea clavata]|uniref:Uncharacterized protein n=1 Tax=Paramuricea clavata TaxID=317549 RepID=A0A7D9HCK5_PARCT|nr:Hypothetical predicted protein [Paramuricea clavata]